MELQQDPPEPVTDLYGYQHTLTLAQQAVRLQCDGTAARGESAWVPMEQALQLPKATLKQMIRQGIPPALRMVVWLQVSGAAAKAAAHSTHFASMVSAGESSSPDGILREIDADCQHACANNPWLQGAEGQAAMRRVLAAYSAHNPRIGYCRPLSRIVGLLLVVLNRNTEAAFWLLAALVEDILQPDTFARDLQGCQVEMRTLAGLIAQKLPRLSAHMASLDAGVSIVATDWFLTLFAASLPPETCARVWDALFSEGAKVLFRTGLAVLQAQEEVLLRCSNAGDLLVAVRQWASSCHNRDALMRTAFEGIGSLSLAAIEHSRQAVAAGQQQQQPEAAGAARVNEQLGSSVRWRGSGQGRQLAT